MNVCLGDPEIIIGFQDDIAVPDPVRYILIPENLATKGFLVTHLLWNRYKAQNSRLNKSEP